jgi:hypothetical protein
MGKHLERYLYSDNPNVAIIRRDMATIAASLDMFTEVHNIVKKGPRCWKKPKIKMVMPTSRLL